MNKLLDQLDTLHEQDVSDHRLEYVRLLMAGDDAADDERNASTLKAVMRTLGLTPADVRRDAARVATIRERLGTAEWKTVALQAREFQHLRFHVAKLFAATFHAAIDKALIEIEHDRDIASSFVQRVEEAINRLQHSPAEGAADLLEACRAEHVAGRLEMPGGDLAWFGSVIPTSELLGLMPLMQAILKQQSRVYGSSLPGGTSVPTIDPAKLGAEALMIIRLLPVEPEQQLNAEVAEDLPAGVVHLDDNGLPIEPSAPASRAAGDPAREPVLAGVIHGQLDEDIAEIESPAGTPRRRRK